MALCGKRRFRRDSTCVLGEKSVAGFQDVVGRKSRLEGALVMRARRQSGETAGRPASKKLGNRCHDDLNDELVLDVFPHGVGDRKQELKLRRRSHAVDDAWRVKPQAQLERQGKVRRNLRYGKHFQQFDEDFILIPLKKFPVRVAKYDVRLRDASLRAAQAMHAILTRMVLFQCHECNERFPTFHPAYTPPPRVVKDM